MKKDIFSVTEYLKKFYKDYNECFQTKYDNSLTAIQNERNKKQREKAFQSKGIKYKIIKPGYDPGGYNPNPQYGVSLYSLPWVIDGVGVIRDVLNLDKHQISLTYGDNISIRCPLRKWNDLLLYNIGGNRIREKTLLKYNKGSEFYFKGKISLCSYLIGYVPVYNERFHFVINNIL